MPKRLRIRPAPPILGRNMHILVGHDRLTFVRKYTSPGAILDVACGEGAFSLWAQAGGNTVYAIDVHDPSPQLVAQGIKFKKISLEEYKTNKKFNTIYMMEIIEHIEEPEEMIAKYFKMLKDGGHLLITTPHVPDWDWEEDHIWRWSFSEFKDMISKIDGMATVWQDRIFLYAVLIREEE